MMIILLLAISVAASTFPDVKKLSLSEIEGFLDKTTANKPYLDSYESKELSTMQPITEIPVNYWNTVRISIWIFLNLKLSLSQMVHPFLPNKERVSSRVSLLYHLTFERMI
jgi:hypothetical protein